MPLAKFDPSYRMIWMFPRNIRRIYPWKIAQISALFRTIGAEASWSGEQKVQKAFCKALESAGLKSPGEQYDPNSGGPRTYFAQLKCLGILFQSSDKKMFYTQAGEDLASGSPPLPILQNLLLKHQYPSCYGSLAQIRMNPCIRVKPFLFVLRLLERLESMTVEELAIPVIYGHSSDCFELCAEKILRFRATGDFHSVIDDYARDLYTPRTKGKDFDSRISDVKDIANTMKNWLQAACLVDCSDRDGKQSISIAASAKDVIEKHRAAEDCFLEYESEESFQRKYGCLRQVKDTRNLRRSSQRFLLEKNIILSKFYAYMGTRILDDYPDDFTEELHSDFGFPEDLIKETIEPHLKKSLSFFSSTYLELSGGGSKDSLAFEKATAQILSSALKFSSKLTGQIKRAGKGGYSDIFVIALDQKHCGIIDGKASSSYNLPAHDFYTMCSNYIPNYQELCDGKPLSLEFCSYVAGGFTNISSSLKKITEETKIGASAVPASELLRLAQIRNIGEKQPQIRETLKMNKILTFKDFKING